MWRQQVQQHLDAEEEEMEVFVGSRDALEQETTGERKIIDAVFSPNDQLHIIVVPADVQKSVLIKEEAPEEQWPDVDQQDTNCLHIKEEEEEQWTILGGEQLSMKEETDVTSFSLTAVHFKSEDDEEKHLFSQLHQHQVEYGDLPTSSSGDHIKSSTGEGEKDTKKPDLNAYRDDSDSSETEVSEDDKEDNDVNNPESQLKLLSNVGLKTEHTDEAWESSPSRVSESRVSPIDQLHIIVVPADVQKSVLIKEEAPEEQWPDVDQQDTNCLHIKQEEEEPWIILGGEQLSMKEETDVTNFSLTAVPFKSEDDEEKPLFSQLHQHQVEVRDLLTNSSGDHIESATGEGTKYTKYPDLIAYREDSDSSETEVSEDDEDDNDVNNPESQLKLFSDFGLKTEHTDEARVYSPSRVSESIVNRVHNKNGLKPFCCDVLVPADVQKSVLIKEEAPEEQWLDVDQQDTNCFHIKEEEEEQWAILGGEQLSMKEETGVTSFSLTAVPFKSEDDEEKPLFSQLHQHQVEVSDLPTSSSETEVSEDEEYNDVNNPESQLKPLSDFGSKVEHTDEAQESSPSRVSESTITQRLTLPKSGIPWQPRPPATSNA
ncbi:uncharacterized protein LOC119425492 [Nematolebias whitei]|uniref:uncharacterized protein LOC119425492 n=1 Tax=Nematolebias whitei TaxID=451745 RepID=UPI00189AC2DF|nr:uncharacterized protein LOC119425492 [Nematolebias whitei]